MLFLFCVYQSGIKTDRNRSSAENTQFPIVFEGGRKKSESSN